MAGKRRSFIRELYTLMPVLETEYNGQVKVHALDESVVNEVLVEITPLKGAYAHASFVFCVKVTSSYPFERPSVTCRTSVFHPNIDAQYYAGNVCLNLLHNWESRFGLKDLFHALLFLFYEPNFLDRLNCATNAEEGLSIEETIHKSLSGGLINSQLYEPNQAWLNWRAKTGEPDDDRKLKDDHPQSMSDSNVCGTPSSLLRQQSTFSNYFRLALSGQYSPMNVSISEEWPHTYTEEFDANFVYAQQITIRQSSQGLGVREVFQNFRRYYFIEQCSPARSSSISELDELSARNSSITHYGDMYASSQLTTWGPWTMAPNIGCINIREPFSDGDLSYRPVVDDEIYGSDGCGEDIHMDHMTTSGPSELISGSETLDEQDEQEVSSFEEDILDNQVTSHGDGIRTGNDRDAEVSHADDVVTSHYTEDAVALKPSAVESEHEALSLDNGMEDIRAETRGQANDALSEQTLDENERHQAAESVVTTCDATVHASDVDYEDGTSESEESSWDEVVNNEEEVHSDVESELSAYIEQPSVLRSILQKQNSLSSQLSPWWWIMYQSRWPVHLAPSHWSRIKYFKQSMCFTRASVAVLWTDLYRVGMKHKEPVAILLVDSLSLSPLSPMLNRAVTFRGQNGRSVHWCGLDWYSLWDAMRSNGCGISSPRIHFRLPSFMFILCYVHNWLAYMSRLELYGSCLGYSRPLRPGVLSNAASTCIVPASLGCGQCSVLDMWPLWLMWRVSRQLCRLAVFLCSRAIYVEECSGPIRTSVCFPFSDLDEI